MADRQIGNHAGVTVRTANQNGGGSASSGFTNANFLDVSTMRARLTALNAAVYTAAKLNEMTANDMVFAIRTLDNPTTL